MTAVFAGWAWLALGGWGLALALAGALPWRRLDSWSVWHFGLGLAGSELAPSLIGGALAIGAVATLSGALFTAWGVVGLWLTQASVLVLAWNTWSAQRSVRALETLASAGAGTAVVDPVREPMLRIGPGPMGWTRPLHFRRPGVRRVRNLSYGPAGRAHRADVYVPQSPPSAGLPVLLMVHGGAWVLGEKGVQGLPLLWHLAARGWVCVDIDYRLAPRARLPAQVEDVKRAIAWIRASIAQYGGDPAFVAVTGGSAGGHLAALAALTAGDPAFQPGFEAEDTSIQAAVPFYGKYDLLDRVAAPRGASRFVDFMARRVMPCTPEADPRPWLDCSPIERVGPHAPPFLVVHGGHDSLIPVAEARAFAGALRAQSRAAVEYAELDGAQHAFDVVHSIRTDATIVAVQRFLEVQYARRRAAR